MSCNNVKQYKVNEKRAKNRNAQKMSYVRALNTLLLKHGWNSMNYRSSWIGRMRQDFWIVTFEHNLNVSVSRAL